MRPEKLQELFERTKVHSKKFIFDKRMTYPIDHGARGTVFFVYMKTPDGEVPVALKVSEGPEGYRKIMRELEILKTGQNNLSDAKYVVKLLDDFELAKDSYVLVLEKGDMDLRGRIETNRLSEDEYYSTLTQICYALIETHERGIWHRDIKPENIILFGRDVKLCDFSEATWFSSDKTTFTIKGTAAYLPPEVLLAEDRALVDLQNKETTEVYSIGAVMWDMVTGDKISNKMGGEMGSIIKNKKDPVLLEGIISQMSAGNAPENLSKVARKCLDPEPERRYQTIAELKEAIMLYPNFEARYNALMQALKEAKPTAFAGVGDGEFSVISLETAQNMAEAKDAFDSFVMSRGLASYAALADLKGKDHDGLYCALKNPDTAAKLNRLALETLNSKRPEYADLADKIVGVNMAFWEVMERTKKAVKARTPHTADSIQDYYKMPGDQRDVTLRGLESKNSIHREELVKTGKVKSFQEMADMRRHNSELVKIFYIL